MKLILILFVKMVGFRYCGECGLFDEPNNDTHAKSTSLPPVISCTLHNQPLTSSSSGVNDKEYSFSKPLHGDDDVVQIAAGDQNRPEKSTQSHTPQPRHDISTSVNSQTPTQLEKVNQVEPLPIMHTTPTTTTATCQNAKNDSR